ncbi:hypothetical protein PCANC_16790 [Puccinia coronata f. sp. avenae]|uniref:alpha-galactosidase n=1 Tax=Puccinia coronata f. sp. avenae TaxID=200324 RepID=A0A2N5UPD6_9BASI|nr:hypothetical protein PCANC_25339 [Puccinia coronata f. sp. avenae]PLW39497.1 hypothetical protein PCANC_16790 [Puccinia coronata f. sp. avenae]
MANAFNASWDALVPGSSFDAAEYYGKCDTRADLAAWRRAIDLRCEQEWQNRAWSGLLDLNSLLISDMTYEESKSTATLWAVLGSPFYLGDDLTRLPDSRKALALNEEALEVTRLASSNPARLERFNRTRLAAAGSRSGNQVRIKDCERLVEKRWMVVGLSLYQHVDPNRDLRQCLQNNLPIDLLCLARLPP